MHREHARHNESLCDHLIEQKKWNDWIVTTAFYSALQYVDHRLFPLKVKAVTYNSIENYCKSNRLKNKHEVRKELVYDHIRKISPSFRWLLNTCHTARYQNYRIAEEVSLEAKRKLEIVKQFCDHDK
jgi:hypothetical protein